MNKNHLILIIVLFLQSLLSVSFAEQESYEVPQILQAKDVVPEDLLKSDLYSIEDEVATRGYTNTYQNKFQIRNVYCAWKRDVGAAHSRN